MSDFTAINALMQEYFRILHEGDVDAIKRVFLPECDLTCPMVDGSLVHMTRAEHIAAVELRDTPKSEGHPLYGQVLMVDQSGPNTALAKVDCAVQPRYFIDYLTLVKRDGEWKIAAKVYCVTRVEE